MQILALETSTELGTCALWRDGEIIERVCPSGRPHSETLLPLVRELLSSAGLSVAGLDAIAFGAGPGAFTGLRVACGAAQGLAEAGGLPVVPIISLEAMAFQTGNEQVVSLLDARMGEVYCANWLHQGDIYALSGEIRVASPEMVPLPESSGWVASGNAPGAYPALAERLNVQGIECRNGILPRAAAVAELAARRFSRGESIDPALAAPLYVRDKVAKTVAERLSEGGRA